MASVLIALGTLVLYVIAYRTYGRYLARRIFRIEPERATPACELEDGIDYVPSRRELVFGHHFTSIAGTGPIVGPAVAVVWGWVPALIWVLVGSIVMGAVHDFGSLVVSMRHRGRTIADLAGDVVNPRVRVLFLIVVLVGLWIVLAVFGLVIAAVFAMFPSSVVPVMVQIPIAVGLGVWMRRGGGLLVGTVVAVVLMYGSIALSANNAWAQLTLPAAITGHISSVGFWTLVLLAYVFVASVLPVQWLLQPRDYINAHQLLIAMGLLVVGLLIAHPPIVADAVNVRPAPAPNGVAAPGFVPFLFVTIACGAISGFHCLVSSGCSSRQLRTEADAQYVGFGAMLTEGFLAVLVILACCAGIGMGTPGREGVLTGVEAWRYHYSVWGGEAGLGIKLAPFITGSANMIEAIGVSHALATAIMGVFVASFAATTMDSACRLQRFVIAELAATGNKRAVRVVCGGCGYSREGLGGAHACPECGKKGVAERLPGWRGVVANRYVATTLAVMTAGVLALSDAVIVERYYPNITIGFAYDGTVVVFQRANPTGFTVRQIETYAANNRKARADWSWDEFDLPPAKVRFRPNLASAGLGGLILWPVFGATNQLLGGLALLVVTVWLVKSGRPAWVSAIPMVFMLAMTGWAIASLAVRFAPGGGGAGRPGLLVVSLLMLALEAWIVVEGVALGVRAGRARGVAGRAGAG